MVRGRISCNEEASIELLKLVKRYEDEICCVGGVDALGVRRKAWQKVADELNARFDLNITALKWKKKFRNIQTSSKQKINMNLSRITYNQQFVPLSAVEEEFNRSFNYVRRMRRPAQRRSSNKTESHPSTTSGETRSEVASTTQQLLLSISSRAAAATTSQLGVHNLHHGGEIHLGDGEFGGGDEEEMEDGDDEGEELEEEEEERDEGKTPKKFLEGLANLGASECGGGSGGHGNSFAAAVEQLENALLVPSCSTFTPNSAAAAQLITPHRLFTFASADGEDLLNRSSGGDGETPAQPNHNKNDHNKSNRCGKTVAGVVGSWKGKGNHSSASSLLAMGQLSSSSSGGALSQRANDQVVALDANGLHGGDGSEDVDSSAIADVIGGLADVGGRNSTGGSGGGSGRTWRRRMIPNGKFAPGGDELASMMRMRQLKMEVLELKRKDLIEKRRRRAEERGEQLQIINLLEEIKSNMGEFTKQISHHLSQQPPLQQISKNNLQQGGTSPGLHQ